MTTTTHMPSDQQTQDDPDVQPPNQLEANRRRTLLITQTTYLFPLLKGIVYPLSKISLIGLAEKLLRTSLMGDSDSGMMGMREGIDPSLYDRIEAEIFQRYDNRITDTFLMRSLDFYQAFAVTGVLIVVVSVLLPLTKALCRDYLNHLEVKRLQAVLYERFILEPNSVAIDQASDLLYTKITAVKDYWEKTKYFKVDDATTILTCLLLILVLAWDLGLACFGATTICIGLSGYISKRLSTPWAQQREDKMRKANAQLIDLVVCKDVVLTHAQEIQEQTKLHTLLTDDATDIQKLFRANFVSESVKTVTFTMITPLLFLLVYTYDRSINRVFQLLIMIVLLDETMRAFLAYTRHAEFEAEYSRAKAGFCHVLGMEEETLFPPDFKWWHQKGKPVEPKPTSQDNNKCPSKITDLAEEEDEELGSSMSMSFDQSMAKRSSRRQSLRQQTEELSELISQALEAPNGAGELSLKNVSFGYKTKDGSKTTVVKNLNMTLQIGQHYAIMGETGVGKSTLLKALSGLHEPLAGDIYFDGKAVDTTSVHWREQVAVVSQDSVFLNRSLRENLCYGLAAIKSEEEIMAALEKVNMKKKIVSLSQGLDTVMEGNGATFSGGQQQRLQIARLLLGSSPLVLLDECTSALDPTTTEEVLQVLRDHLAGKTMIMITHDVDTLVLAEHVLEMKADGIIERAQDKRVASVYGGDGEQRPPDTTIIEEGASEMSDQVQE